MFEFQKEENMVYTKLNYKDKIIQDMGDSTWEDVLTVIKVSASVSRRLSYWQSL